MIFSIYEWSLLYITIYAFGTYFVLNKELARKIFILLTSAHLFFIQGLRSVTVGGDLETYFRHFTSTQHSSLEGGVRNIYDYENGYNSFTAIISNSSLSFQFFIGLISLVNIIILAWAIYKYSTNPYISYMFYIILGFYDFGFSGLRQSLAMSIILISFQFIENKKPLLFIITIIIASLFHNTALIFIIIYLFKNKMLRKYYYKIYFFIVLMIAVFGNRIGLLLTNMFNEDYISYGSSENTLGTTAIIISLMLILSYYAQLKSNDLKNNKRFSDLFDIVSVSLLIQLLSSYSYLFTRLNFFFYQFIIFLIPMIYDMFTNNILGNNKYGKFLLKYVINILLFIILLLYFHNYLKQNPHEINPHYFYWK